MSWQNTPLRAMQDVILVFLTIMMVVESATLKSGKDKLRDRVLLNSSKVRRFTDDVGNSEYPYVVDLAEKVKGKLTHRCAGTILTASIILTSCHCVAEIDLKPELRSPKNYSIVAGTRKLNRNSPTRQVRNIRRFTVHSECNYIGITVANDVAVIHLEEPLVFNDNVKPVKIYSKEVEVWENEYQRLIKKETVCDSPGWRHRSTRKTDVNTDTLQSSMMKLINATECRRMFCKAKFRADALCKQNFHRLGQICTASYNGVIPCAGDSGGPLICNGALFGIVSWGGPCTPLTPEVYAGPKIIWDLVQDYLTVD